MSSSEAFIAQSRAASGTGNARAVRLSGFVPGIIYGNKKDPEMISLDPKHLMRECQAAGFFSRVYKISIEGKEQQVVAKDIQLHPVTDAPLHVDFQRINKDSKIHLHLPISFINEDKSPGIKRGGVLNVILHSLEVVCSPLSIPESLIVDLTGLDLNQSIPVGTLKLAKDIVIAHPERDHTVATVVAPSGLVEETTEGETAATETAAA